MPGTAVFHDIAFHLNKAARAGDNHRKAAWHLARASRLLHEERERLQNSPRPDHRPLRGVGAKKGS